MTMTKFPTPEIAAGVAALIAKADEIMAAHWAERGYTYAKPDTHEVESIGKAFARIVSREYDGRDPDGEGRIGSVFCFVAMRDGKTKELGEYKAGQIFKAATYYKPAKHARGCIWTDLSKVTPYGMAYLK